MSNVHVPHPKSLIRPISCSSKAAEKFFLHNNKFLQWITDHVLASMLMFDLALLVPLLVFLPPFSGLKDVVIIISSNWIQLWALFALQRSSSRAEITRQAKADADHEALTHIANTVDAIDNAVREGNPPLNK